jgi:16S rRNA (uracil1498-N3)-methyltransferase
MRLHRFYITQPIVRDGVNHFSSDTLVHQLSHVFRLHEGDKVIFFDGTGVDCECEIVSLERSEVVFRVVETYSVKPQSETKVVLALSLIKKDNFEWVIQKGTELGVSEFVPLISERSEKKGLNMERATKILVEAIEQSGRSDIPTIREPQMLADFLAEEKRNVVAFHVTGDVFKKEIVPVAGEVVLCVGPEGGWSDKEIEMFKAKNAKVVSLNTPVLRAETAAIAISTLFLVK